MAKQLRVLMLYSHSLLLAGLEQRLLSTPGITLQHASPDISNLFEEVREFHPDVVLLDERDPGLDVSHIVWQLLDTAGEAQILVLNASERISNLYERHPVTATTPEELIQTIHAWREKGAREEAVPEGKEGQSR